MPDSYPSQTHVRSALFIDFDNIYLGLQREDPTAAEQFATDPTRWLLWLQDRLPHQDGDGRSVIARPLDGNAFFAELDARTAVRLENRLKSLAKSRRCQY